jgi:hypothetical protein
MSKKVDAQITCPNCQNEFNISLYRTIWGEFKENRELVMSDEINVAVCPSCKNRTKLSYALMYTHKNPNFAVWWEPEHDSQIDIDIKDYIKYLGEGNYFATAPRIRDWQEFKNIILKFETGEIKANQGYANKELKKELEGYMAHLAKQNKKNKKTGCSSIILAIVMIIGAIYFL